MATHNPLASTAGASGATKRHATASTTREESRRSDGDRDGLLAKIKTDFDDRLARMAADPAQWIEFIDHVAAFGARYSLGNQILLLVQADERGITPATSCPTARRTARPGGSPTSGTCAPVRRRSKFGRP